MEARHCLQAAAVAGASILPHPTPLPPTAGIRPSLLSQRPWSDDKSGKSTKPHYGHPRLGFITVEFTLDVFGNPGVPLLKLHFPRSLVPHLPAVKVEEEKKEEESQGEGSEGESEAEAKPQKKKEKKGARTKRLTGRSGCPLFMEGYEHFRRAGVRVTIGGADAGTLKAGVSAWGGQAHDEEEFLEFFDGSIDPHLEARRNRLLLPNVVRLPPPLR